MTLKPVSPGRIVQERRYFKVLGGMAINILYLLLITHSGFLIILIIGRFIDFLFSECINLTEQLHYAEVEREEEQQNVNTSANLA